MASLASSAPHSPTCACVACRADLTTCSVATFAATVRAATAQLGAHGRFGARKVFIWAVYAALLNGGHAIPLAAFKARLVLAARGGHLELARADLVAAMPRLMVEQSQIDDGGQQVHFVVDAAAAEPWAAEPMPRLVSHGLERHAGHGLFGVGGHDLERWVVEAPSCPSHPELIALGLAADARWESGGALVDGRRQWLYTAIRPMSPGTCERCASTRLTEVRS
jgi:hypothetical protein